MKLVKCLILLCSIVFLTSCLTPEQGAQSLPGASPSEALDSSAASPGNRYYLPPSFNCHKPGSSASKPGQFNEFQCMVCNCVHEAGGENAEGREAVGRVVLARLWSPHYPSSSVCSAVYQRSQFSWTNGTRIENKIIGTSGSAYSEKVRRCKASMINVYENHTTSAFATHYWSPCGMCAIRGYRNCNTCPAWAKNPAWAKDCRGRKRIGNHIFCTGGVGGIRPVTPRGPVAPRYSSDTVAYCPIKEGLYEI